MPPQNDKPVSRLLVFATVTFYMISAIAMVLTNKWVLSKTSIPVFFLFIQLGIAVILLALSKVLGIFPIQLELNPATCKALVPMIAINVLGLNFNNLTLKYVDASFYQVARGLLLPITVGLSGIILHTRPSLRILGSCAVVTAGFFVGVLIDSPSSAALFGSAVASTVAQAKAPSLLGIMFGILSSCTTALHAVVIKRSLDAVQGSTLQLAWYSNVLSSLVMLPMVFLAGEIPKILDLFLGAAQTSEGSTTTALGTFLYGSAITGCVGFLICIAGFLSIKITSPITHMVSAAVRGVLQTFLSVALFKDVITTGRASSITLILGGSIYYTWVKNDETNKTSSQQLPKYNASAPPTPFAPSTRDEDDRVGKMEDGGFHGRKTSQGLTSPGGSNGYDRIPLEEMRTTSPKPNGDRH